MNVTDKSPFAYNLAANRKTLTEEVVELIRSAILGGHYSGNQQITESRISEEFNISRGPVREALRELVASGLVVHHANRGYFLREFTIDDIEEICLVRIALEKLAVKLAVKRATDDELAELAETIKNMGTGVRDMQRASMDDYQFHFKICQLAKLQRLQDMWSLMADQTCLAIAGINQSFDDSAPGFVGEHREILDALRERKAGKAMKLIEKHILLGVKNLKNSIQKD